MRDKSGVTLTSTVLPSEKQLAANLTCLIPREKNQFVEDGVVKNCRYDGDFAVVEVFIVYYILLLNKVVSRYLDANIATNI